MSKGCQLKLDYIFPLATEYVTFVLPEQAGTYAMNVTLNNNTMLNAGNITVGNEMKIYKLTVGYDDGTTQDSGYFTTGVAPAASTFPFQVNVARYASSTYVNSVSYTDDAFIGFSVSTGENLCLIVYDGAARIVPPNRTDYSVIFGKYAGADDGTAASGVVGFSTGFTNIKTLSFNKAKSTTDYCKCVKGIAQWWSADYLTVIPNYFLQYQGTSYDDNIGDITIPAFITDLGLNVSTTTAPLENTYIGTLSFAGNTTTGYAENTFVDTLIMDSNFAQNTALGLQCPTARKKIYSVTTHVTNSNCWLKCTTATITSNVQQIHYSMLCKEHYNLATNVTTRSYATVTRLKILATTPPTISDMYRESGKNIFCGVTTIEVPASALSAYQNDATWGLLSSKLVASADGGTSGGGGASGDELEETLGGGN